MRGEDSAGATIEIEMYAGFPIKARVIDLALGTGEAEFSGEPHRAVDFSVRFPAGARITYVGQTTASYSPDSLTYRGTWYQHAEGIFGTDSGTWEVAHSQRGRE